MLDLDPQREGPPPREAATLVVARDTPRGVEVFCVERHKKSRFMGGAIVFPGGKLDEDDRDPAWADLATTSDPGAGEDPTDRPLRITACRETLEEAAILPVSGGALTHAELLDLRARVAARTETLAGFLRARALRLDLAALHPFARWVTPAAESRRFDTRFYIAVAPPGQDGAHDERETTSSFWARPADVITRFEAGEVQLAPPTHRTLQISAPCPDVRACLARAATLSLEPICPVLVKHADARGETLALVLPGDPEHPVREPRLPGTTRYVLRGDRFLAEDPPAR